MVSSIVPAAVLLLFMLLFAAGLYNRYRKLPRGISIEGHMHPACDVAFLRDLTWLDERGGVQTDQQIFAEVQEMIRRARHFILLDFFLFNDFTGCTGGACRPLAAEITQELLARKESCPGMRIIFITDPINTVYGSLENRYLERLRRAGVEVFVTRLEQLRDSNPLYSCWWRLGLRHLGDGPRGLLPNPFGRGRVSGGSYLRLLNFKANHRKLIVTDHVPGYRALVTSANPHDGSSMHANVALRFSGAAAAEILASERAVPGVQAERIPRVGGGPGNRDSGLSIQVLTEGKIRKVLLHMLHTAEQGDRLHVIMFYLAERGIIEGFKHAHRRGVQLRVLLDPNRDAFGRIKNGIPNRQTAGELVREGIAVRWGNTHGEQLHTKMVLLEKADGCNWLLLGSANLTRRNLGDFNLETDVAVYGPADEEVFREARGYAGLLWNNPDGREFSLDYAAFADHSLLRKICCRWMEMSGMSAF